jgi:hypothetical protein
MSWYDNVFLGYPPEWDLPEDPEVKDGVYEQVLVKGFLFDAEFYRDSLMKAWLSIDGEETNLEPLLSDDIKESIRAQCTEKREVEDLCNCF